MNAPDRPTGFSETSELSVLSLISTILRRRRTIYTVGFLGAFAGALTGLLSRHVYQSTATFLTQGGESSVSGLAAAASQFGIRIPTSGPGWSVPVYVELLRSRALLEPIAMDTIAVLEEGGKRESVMDLLKVKAPTPALRTDLTINTLRGVVVSAEDKERNAVTVTVTTRWPSVSFEIAKKMLLGVDRFNSSTRRSQASAERQFAQQQSAQELTALRAAEDQLQQFLQRNRVLGSPALEFERDRLQRDVNLHQQIYNTMVQGAEEARIREVRDTPVITVLESPVLPTIPRPRRTAFKTIAGGLVGGILGTLFVFFAGAVARWRSDDAPASREFFQLVDQIAPRVLLRGQSRSRTPIATNEN